MSETKLYQNLHPEHPGSIGPKRAGRRARFSFIGTDENGKPVRKWHRDPHESAGPCGMAALPKGVAESLRGMVRP